MADKCLKTLKTFLSLIPILSISWSLFSLTHFWRRVFFVSYKKHWHWYYMTQFPINVQLPALVIAVCILFGVLRDHKCILMTAVLLAVVDVVVVFVHPLHPYLYTEFFVCTAVEVVFAILAIAYLALMARRRHQRPEVDDNDNDGHAL